MKKIFLKIYNLLSYIQSRPSRQHIEEIKKIAYSEVLQFLCDFNSAELHGHEQFQTNNLGEIAMY